MRRKRREHLEQLRQRLHQHAPVQRAQLAPARDTEHLRRRLEKWSETAAERITKDMEALEMHSAVRNVMRLLERIKDYEKRVVARRGDLGPLDRRALVDALAQLIQMLAPLAPHIAEELWSVLGGAEDVPQMPWPGVSFGVPA